MCDKCFTDTEQGLIVVDHNSSFKFLPYQEILEVFPTCQTGLPKLEIEMVNTRNEFQLVL